MSLTKILSISIITIVAGGGLFFFLTSNEFNLAAVGSKKAKKEPSAPVQISGSALEQGDTLFIRVKKATTSAEVSGNFGKEKINFFIPRDGEDLVALVGIDVKTTPGKYDLAVDLPFGKNFQKEIRILKRKFPVTDLKVTKELEAKGLTPSKIVKNILGKEKPTLDPVLKMYTPEAYLAGPFIRPLSEIKIGGEFGNIRKRGSATFQHLGVDLDAPVGTPVYAVNDGAVSFSEELDTYGKTLVVDHGLGIYSLYLHLDTIGKKQGEAVKKGEVIASSGNSGYSLQPHLHFSIKVNGASVDPLRFIKTAEKHL